MPSEASNAQINKFLTKIDEKSLQLKTTGTTRGDLEILKNSRLNLIWGEPNEQSDRQDVSATTWRRNRARRVYLEVQAVDNHLFLAFALVIPPTVCAKTSFNDVMEHLTRLESYESYRLNLSPAIKKIFESIAAEQGFTSSRHYLSFMQTLFPQREEPRQIQFAYSLIRLEDIPAFFETIQQGI